MSIISPRRCLLLIAAAACAAGGKLHRRCDDARVIRQPDFVSGDISRDGRYLSQDNWNSGDIQLVDLLSGESTAATVERHKVRMKASLSVGHPSRGNMAVSRRIGDQT